MAVFEGMETPGFAVLLAERRGCIYWKHLTFPLRFRLLRFARNDEESVPDPLCFKIGSICYRRREPVTARSGATWQSLWEWKRLVLLFCEAW